MEKEQRHAQRQLRKDIFISVLAVISVGIGIYDLARPPTSAEFRPIDIIDLAIVLVFVIEFTWSAVKSGHPGQYVKKHWYELPAMIPITGNMVVGASYITLLRGVRLIRVFRVVRLLRVVGALGRFDAFWKRFFRILRRAHIGGLAIFAVCSILVGAALAWLVESPTNPRFAAADDALWWGVNMFSNVAYVDFQPATTAGRIVAGTLEFTGIAFIGLFTASLANALFREEKDEEEVPEDDAPLD